MKKIDGRPTYLTRDEAIEIVIEGNRRIKMNASDFDGFGLKSSSSFRYESDLVGLKSTQQINIDWSKLENHVFFESAAAKINFSFDKIINNFPFDGTKEQLTSFVGDLTGFEKYVLDNFPKNTGSINFDGTNYIQVIDRTGGKMPEAYEGNPGLSILDQMSDSGITFEGHWKLSSDTNTTQVLFQKSGSNVQIYSYLKPSATSTAEVVFSVQSGSSYSFCSATINKNQNNHLGFVLTNSGQAKIFLSGVFVSSGSQASFNDFNTLASSILISSGTKCYVSGIGTITPTQTFSGSLDEFRYFKKEKTESELKKYSNKSIFNTPDLLLYFKFNEPSGSLVGTSNPSDNSIVLDSSGNGHHSYIQNFSFANRNTDSLISKEDPKINPVLFPYYSGVSDLNYNLLYDANRYDEVNPNLITKLIPRHFLSDGREYNGFLNNEGPIVEDYEGIGPKQGQLQQTQILIALLYSWAKFFDEIKIFIDAFSKVNYVELGSSENTPDVFLRKVLKNYGFEFPNIFSESSLEEYFDGYEVDEDSISEYSLSQIQSELLKRLVANAGEIVRSKGTIHSIEAFFRSIGIDPENSIKIKEYGGSGEGVLSQLKTLRTEIVPFLKFSGAEKLTSRYLSGTKIEPGYPLNGPNPGSNGMYTSGSWTIEGLYKAYTTGSEGRKDSLLQVFSTGSKGENLILNVVANSGTVTLYARPNSGSTPVISMSLNADIYDGNNWLLSVGRQRNDYVSGNISGSLFLRLAKQEYGEITKFEKTSSNYYSNNDVFENYSTTVNSSGTFYCIGTSSLNYGSSYTFLNDSSILNSDILYTKYSGYFSKSRFFSKYIDDEEMLEHANNPNSFGVKDPVKNYSFNKVDSGSFERLRVSLELKQTQSTNGAGLLTLVDDTQETNNICVFSGSSNTKYIYGLIFRHKEIAGSYDESINSEKIRIRSYQSSSINPSSYQRQGNVYEVRRSEKPLDDNRLAIEISLSDALDRDIINLLGTTEFLESALGKRISDLEEGYPELDKLRSIYSNRLVADLDFNKFNEFYRWIDGNSAEFIKKIIPFKTKFLGMRFVVKSHSLERHRKVFYDDDAYMPEGRRSFVDDKIYLQQVVGIVGKY